MSLSLFQLIPSALIWNLASYLAPEMLQKHQKDLCAAFLRMYLLRRLWDIANVLLSSSSVENNAKTNTHMGHIGVLAWYSFNT